MKIFRITTGNFPIPGIRTEQIRPVSSKLDPDNTGTLTLDGQTMTVGALQPGSFPVVFPNPFSDRLHLCFSDRKGAVTVGVYDLIGNCLFIKETVILHEEKLDLYLQGLNRGMYFLYVQDKSDRFVLKIMKL